VSAVKRKLILIEKLVIKKNFIDFKKKFYYLKMKIIGVNNMVERLIKNREVVELLKKNNVAMLGLFGSYARREETENSDLDFLIKFSKKTSLLGHIRLQRQLSEILDREVDLVTENSINPYLREKIMAELRVIYNAEG